MPREVKAPAKNHKTMYWKSCEEISRSLISKAVFYPLNYAVTQ